MRKIELLAPARNAEVGIEAFRHGADAVYIGAPSFGARASASNSVHDIEQLARFGHQFGAKTIIAFNTILTDQELLDAERMAWQLYEAGADALIIQDLGLLQMNLPPIELHASTQTDNRTVEKVRLLSRMGFTRVVLARELSIQETRVIHEAVPEVELECFVHGALCVCVSGQCYMSAALTGRSANRGECAQPCRLPMDLLASDGHTALSSGRHLLSLRDMNRSSLLEPMIEAGVTSLKIEGRLKDMPYVKNVVAYYRRQIDALLERHPDWYAASEGKTKLTFDPQPDKSFNRGFTTYFAESVREPMWNFESPKSQGEWLGTIRSVQKESFMLDAVSSQVKSGNDDLCLHNGDGLVVGSAGFRLNRTEPKGDKQWLCFPLEGRKVCQKLHAGQQVYRNSDVCFEQQLSKPSAKRVLPITISFEPTETCLSLTMSTLDERGEATMVAVRQEGAFEPAKKPQDENIRLQLSKLGDTIFYADSVRISRGDLFVPSSVLADMRRRCVALLLEEREKLQTATRRSFEKPDYRKLLTEVDARGILPQNFLANILNKNARQSLAEMRIEYVDDAFEIQHNKEGLVMQTRHCLKYAFGQCPKYSNPKPEILLQSDARLGSEVQLKIGNRKFILKFGCKNDCISEIFTIFAPELNPK